MMATGKQSSMLWQPVMSSYDVDEWRVARTISVQSVEPPWRTPAALSNSFRWTTKAYNKVEPLDSPTHSETKELAPNNLSIVLSDMPDEDDNVSQRSLEGQLIKAFRAVEVNGFIAVEVLPGVLAALKLSRDSEVVHQAIQSVIPNQEDGKALVSLDQALLVLHRILDAKDKETEESTKDATEPSEAVDSSQNRTLCLLLVTVVVVIFLCAATVAGLAIMWLWLTSVKQNGDFLQMDLNLNGDMLQVMLHEEYTAQRQQLALDYAVIIGTLVEEIGFGLTNSMAQDGLSSTALILQRTLDKWWQGDSMVGLADAATMLGTVVGLVAKNLSLSKATNLTDYLNNEVLPQGHEVLLAKQGNSSLQYLSRLRYAAECNASGCNLGSAANQPMVLALSNKSGAVRGMDYRGQSVAAGYANVTAAGVGVVYKVDSETLLGSFAGLVSSIVDTFNNEASNSLEVTLARILPNGTKRFMTQLIQCSGACRSTAEAALPTAQTAMARALRGQTGIMETVDYRGDTVIAAITFVASCKIGVVVKMSKATLKMSILQQVATILNGINDKFSSSEELELQTSTTVNGTQRIVPLTTYRYACPNNTCATSAYIKAAANGCKTGSAESTDYRGVAVTSGYMCLSNLNSYVAYSVDQAEIVNDEVSVAVESTNRMNENGSSTFELVLGQTLNGTSRYAVSKGVGQDFTTITHQKFATDFGCPNSFCRGRETCMQNALRGFQGTLDCVDYRNVSVQAAATYLDDFQLGLTAEMDMAEVMNPVLSTAYILIGVSCGALFGTAALLSWYTRAMVKSMMVAEQEGQETIIREKQRFSALVEAMYPTYVVGRVLAGDPHIVQMLPHTAVFFSDIYNFTLASSRISSEELLQLMGYTYGVMDKVAEHFHITKVKTVGDAYLAISGLPGVETTNCCMDMMRFASTVAQVFSCKFDHPGQGAVLDLFQPRVGKKKGAGSLLGKGSSADQRVTSSTAPSTVPRQSVASDPHSGVVSDQKSVQSSSTDPYGTVPKVRCIMAYGIAAGAVTAGVLQGKSPMFDIWGKTVNLASRMQSTGQPGRIQVSELFYKSIIAIPGQQYTFEESHQTMCKGFGLVRCYFVQSTTETPPMELVEFLGLEPNMGVFFYESPVSHIKGSFNQRADGSTNSSNTPAPTTGAQHLQSTAASRPTAPRKQPRSAFMEKTNPQVVHREDPLVLLEVSDPESEP